MELRFANRKSSAKFTQAINLNDGTWTECDFEDAAAHARATDHTVRKAYKRPMAADWAYNSDALFLYHQAGVAVDTVDRVKFAELLYYDKGCMFARHVDRQVAPTMLAHSCACSTATTSTAASCTSSKRTARASSQPVTQVGVSWCLFPWACHTGLPKSCTVTGSWPNVRCWARQCQRRRRETIRPRPRRSRE